MTERSLYSIKEVAKILKKRPYQITYVLDTGRVPEPEVRLGNRRAWDMDEIKMLLDYFDAKGGK
jgi:hypothetical protein